MTEHEGREETTAELVDAIAGTYRERRDAEPEDDGAAVSDVELQADALSTAAGRLGVLLTADPTVPHRYLDVYAVLHALSLATGSIAVAATELRRQNRFDLAGGEEAWEEWEAGLAGLRAASSAFGYASESWM